MKGVNGMMRKTGAGLTAAFNARSDAAWGKLRRMQQGGDRQSTAYPGVTVKAGVIMQF